MFRLWRRGLSGWAMISSAFVLLIAIPNFAVLVKLLQEPNQNWLHIKHYLLQEYIVNTLVLVVATGLLTTLIGVSLAWLVTAYSFPGSKFFKWGLILPLAIPPYIAAYTYNGLLNYTGVVQSFLRNALGVQVQQRFFDIMSMEGAIFVLTFCLFPYVFTITKAFLAKQSAGLVESARVLGSGPLELFFQVVLPIARAAIISGVSLVMLEVLNDYGVVKYFGVVTFSSAIFKTWFSMGDIDSAVRLASMLMVLVVAVLLLERLLRGGKQYSYSTARVRPLTAVSLKGFKGVLAFSYCAGVMAIGFAIPVVQLLYWSYLSYEKVLNISFLWLLLSSLGAAVAAAGMIVVIAVIVANYRRISGSWLAQLYGKLTILGYSIPGAVIAIAVIVFFVQVDRSLFGKLVLSSSLAMLMFAYVIRFLAVGFNAVEAGYDKVGKRFFEAARTLGLNTWETFIKVDLPMIRPALLSGFILVFVDILKELPLTLLLRPFNFNTLATRAYEYASDEMVAEAAIASIIIILVGTVSVYLFNRMGEQEEG